MSNPDVKLCVATRQKNNDGRAGVHRSFAARRLGLILPPKAWPKPVGPAVAVKPTGHGAGIAARSAGPNRSTH